MEARQVGSRTISVRLTDEQLNALQAQAELTNVTTNRIVGEAVDLYLDVVHPVAMSRGRTTAAAVKRQVAKKKDTVSYTN